MVTPACAVTCPARASTGPSASSRRRSSTISPCSGTDPPTRPVLPPWGTTAAPASPHARSTAATSSTAPGRTTAGVDPTKRPVQSRTWPATTSGSVSTCASPTTRSAGRRAATSGAATHGAYGGAKIRACRSSRRRCAATCSSRRHRSWTRTSTERRAAPRARRRRRARHHPQPADRRARSRRCCPSGTRHASAPGVVFSGGPVAPEAVIALARGGYDAARGLGLGARRGRHRRRRRRSRRPRFAARRRSACSSATRVGHRASSRPSSSRRRGSWSRRSPIGPVLDRIPSGSGATCCAASAAASRCSRNYPADPTVN